MPLMPFDADAVSFYKGGKVLSFDYILRENDDILTGDKVITKKSKEGDLAKAVAERSAVTVDYGTPVEAVERAEPVVQETAAEVKEEAPAPVEEIFRLVLNGRSVTLDPRPNNEPHQFIELMAIADIDLDNPSPSGDMIMTINGKEASFMDTINYGDNIIIRWADK